MFYDNFLVLCAKAGVSPSAAVVAIGLNKSAVTAWKRGGQPTDATLVKLADYFGVSADVFRAEKKPTADDDELLDYLEMLRSRPECRVFLDTIRTASKEQVEENIRFLDALRKAREE